MRGLRHGPKASERSRTVDRVRDYSGARGPGLSLRPPRAPPRLHRPLDCSTSMSSRAHRPCPAAPRARRRDLRARAALVAVIGGSRPRCQTPTCVGPMAKQKPGSGKGQPAGRRQVEETKQPNIVMVMTDDQAQVDDVPESMPNLYRQLMAAGHDLHDYIVTTPALLPLPGRLPDRPVRPQQRRPAQLLPRPEARSRTCCRPGSSAPATAPPTSASSSTPTSRATLGPAAVGAGLGPLVHRAREPRYYDSKASKNGQVRHYGTDDDDHATTRDERLRGPLDQAARPQERAVLHAGRLLRPAHRDRAATPAAPRRPSPSRRTSTASTTHPLPQPAELQRGDVSDKPRVHPATAPADRRRESPDQRALPLRPRVRLRRRPRHRPRSCDALGEAGELNNTVIMFTSDNGFFYGEHRIAKGKPDPYEENVTMPLTIWAVPSRYRDGAADRPDLRRAGRQHRSRADDPRPRRHRAVPDQAATAGSWTAAR